MEGLFSEVHMAPVRHHKGCLTVVCWSGICGLGSIEIGSLGPIGTLPLDHKAGFPESQFGLLPDINKPPLRGGLQRLRLLSTIRDFAAS